VSDDGPNTPSEPVALSTVAFQHRCPRCGEGRLFSSYLKVAPACEVCGLSLENHDAGDGPAFFVMFPLCIITAVLALLLDVLVTPPIWVHIVLWPVVIIGFTWVALPPVKALMIGLQYRHRDVETYDPSNQQ